MSKVVSKGRNTWDDGSVMNYKITDEGIMYISGVLPGGNMVEIRSKSDFHHIVFEEGVTSIGGCKNYGMFYEMLEIEELTFPASLQSIGSRAFNGCKNLKRVNFAEGLEKLGNNVFEDCKALKEVCLPQSVCTLGTDLFYGCSSLTRVVLPKNLKCIPLGTFRLCSALEIIQIPKGVTSIGPMAFERCEALTSITLPSRIKEIRSSAFNGCVALESINFPSSIEKISSKAFDGCHTLKDIALPNPSIELAEDAFGKANDYTLIDESGNEFYCSISNSKTEHLYATIDECRIKVGHLVIPESFQYEGKTCPILYIQESAFSGTDNLVSVKFPDSVKVIMDYAFSDCNNLKFVKFGKSMRSIGRESFSNCRELEFINFGPSLEYIGYDAFNGCRSLRSVSLPETVTCLACYAFEYTKIFEEKKGVLYLDHVLFGYGGDFPDHSYLEVKSGTTVVAERAFTERPRLEGVIFNEGLKHIGYCAFYECEDLKYIKLPKSLVSIGDDAFKYTAIKEVVAPWKKPIDIDYMPFPRMAVIYIPKGSLDAYSQAKYWKEYKLVER